MRFMCLVIAGAAGVFTGFLPVAANSPAVALVSAGRPADHAPGPGVVQLGGAADSTPVAVSPDGSKVFVGGQSLVAYNPVTGAPLWAAAAGTFPGGCCAVVVGPGGSTLFAAGQALDASGTQEYATAAFDAATGAQLWAAIYHGPGAGSDRTRSVAVSPDGSKVFVTGQSSNTTSNSFDSAYATVAYDAATGAQLWVARYAVGAQNADAYSVAVSPDGSRVFVTGGSAGATGIYMFATVAYNAATGAQLWVARYAVGARNAGAQSIAVSADGSRVYVAGTVHVKGGQQDFATVAYDAASGAKLWAAFYPRGVIISMTVSPDGSKVFVTGQSRSVLTGLYGYATVAYNAATGAQLWARRSQLGGLGLPFSMAVSPDGSKVFVTGYATTSGSTSDYATVAYNAATGAQLWARLYTGKAKGLSQAHGVAVSPDGSKVFVTGVSPALNGRDDATVAYNAAIGTVLWVARH